MRPVDRLFQDAATFGRLIKSWLVFIVVIFCGSFLKDPSSSGAALSLAETAFNVFLFLFVLVFGARLFVTLMRGPERESDQLRQ